MRRDLARWWLRARWRLAHITHGHDEFADLGCPYCTPGR
jgi:hypothetical protein